jgi:beta-galactosidase/beta-glucuronidase
VESIKQYAIWTKIENWDVKHFAETWVEKTKANAAAVKQNWTKEMETALMSAVPGRWRDIQAILQEAQPHAAGAQ